MQIAEDRVNFAHLHGKRSEHVGQGIGNKTPGIIHLSGSTRVSRMGLAVLLAKRLGLNEKLPRPVRTQQMGWVAKRPRDSSSNLNKASTLRAEPLPIENALEEFVIEEGMALRVFANQLGQAHLKSGNRCHNYEEPGKPMVKRFVRQQRIRRRAWASIGATRARFRSTDSQK